MTDTNASWGARHHSVPPETVFGHLSGFWRLTRCVPSFLLNLVWGRNRDVGITGGGFWLSPRHTAEQLWPFIVGVFLPFLPPKPWCYLWKSRIVTPITRQVALPSSPLLLPLHWVVHYPLHWVVTKGAKKEWNFFSVFHFIFQAISSSTSSFFYSSSSSCSHPPPSCPSPLILLTHHSPPLPVSNTVNPNTW